MINRIYIDNYKCFSNFEIRPTAMQLFLGENGSGKTTLFDVLEILRLFITKGMPTEDAFPAGTLTAWDARREQVFELDIAGNGGQYKYRLVVGHDLPRGGNRVLKEQLAFDNVTLYLFDEDEAHLFRDDGSAGPVFPFDWTRSAISTIPSRGVNQLLAWFRRHLERLHVLSPEPVRMAAQSEGELFYPDRRLNALVSWLRHLWQQRADFGAELLKSLREIIVGLSNISLDRTSETSRVLRFEFKFSPQPKGGKSSQFLLRFDQLSDGQRGLVALYSILLSLIDEDSIICLDEPDNYVTLRELQPWLNELRDRVAEKSGQCLLISHHPEAINLLAAKHGLLFYRDESGPVRSKPFEWSGEAILPAELVARGWS
jgi:energy-coupling factor transporter ATP-binding protein EcfA2